MLDTLGHINIHYDLLATGAPSASSTAFRFCMGIDPNPNCTRPRSSFAGGGLLGCAVWFDRRAKPVFVGVGEFDSDGDMMEEDSRAEELEKDISADCELELEAEGLAVNPVISKAAGALASFFFLAFSFLDINPESRNSVACGTALYKAEHQFLK